MTMMHGNHATTADAAGRSLPGVSLPDRNLRPIPPASALYRPARALGPRLPALAFALCALFLSSCDLFTYKRPFADAYYDNNFIAALGFDKFVGADGPETIWVDPLAPTPVAINPDSEGRPLPVTGNWDLAYRYDADWDGYDYLEITDSGNTASFYDSASGLDPAAPVYRVEVKNLVEGGNFETDESARWSGTGTRVWQTSPNPLFGVGSERIDLEAGQDALYTGVPLAGFPGFSSNITYNLFFRYNLKTLQAKIVIDGLESFLTLNPTGSGVKGAAKYTINNGLPSAPVVQVLPLNAGDTLDEFYIDNFRVGRKGNMDLRLLLAPSETDPVMVPGTYSFSVWAYADPLARDYDNPYKLDMFRVKMAVAAGTTYLSTTTAVYGEASGWQKLTATLKPGALSFPYGTPEPVLALVLDLNESRPGSVLLSQPELRFYPDGL